MSDKADASGWAAKVVEGAVVLTDGTTYQARGRYTGRELVVSNAFDDVIATLMASGERSISLGPGRFTLQEPIQLRDGMTIRGAGSSTALECRSPSAEAVIVAEGTTDVTVADLTVRPGRGDSPPNGVLLSTCMRARVDSVVAVGFAGAGIWLREHSGLCYIDRSVAMGNGRANILLQNLAHGPHGDFVPNFVTGSIVARGGAGIECNRAVLLNISSCIAYQTGQPGYLIVNRSNSVAISACRSFQTESDGVRVNDSDELTLSANVFGWQTGHGVSISGSRWGVICGNSIIDTGSHNPGGPDLTTRFADVAELPPPSDGIRLSDVVGYTVTGNAVFNWGVVPKMGVGIREGDGSRQNTLIGNNINYYESSDIDSLGDEIGTMLSGNIGCGADPYRVLPYPAGTLIQSFRPELLDRVIEDML